MEDNKKYRYTLTLNPAVESERELIELIQNRDLLEYPTMKLFLLKCLIKKETGPVSISQIEKRISDIEQTVADMKQIMGELICSVEDYTESSGKNEEILEETTEDDAVTEKATDTENDFAAAFLKSYSR